MRPSSGILRHVTVCLLPLSIALAEAACQAQPSSQATREASGATRAGNSTLVIPTPGQFAPVTVSSEEQKNFMMKSARSAWSFIERNYRPASGFPQATENYEFVTIWDVGSALAAYYSAHQLGLIPESKYRNNTKRALETLARMPLYDGRAPNKLFASSTGFMVDRNEKKTEKGYGVSVIDLGRLLIWLHIIAENDSTLAPLAREVVARYELKDFVKDGYLMGEDLDPANGKVRKYQEGRIGYEQYAAEGFALWGVRAERALDFAANGKPVRVNGHTVLADKRRTDMLTSEPFVMMGMELGWTGPHWRPLSLGILAAQEERWKQTGTITMVSEDAVPIPPAYFYYYLLHRDGKDFVVASPLGEPVDKNPRWVSAKAAFGYHALSPSDYTWKALQAVKYGSNSEGWTAGAST
jgi:hypothetical protein